MYQLSLLFLNFYHKVILGPKCIYFQFRKKCMDNDYTNFKVHDFTIFLLPEFDGPHTKQKEHIQQCLLNSCNNSDYPPKKFMYRRVTCTKEKKQIIDA